MPESLHFQPAVVVILCWSGDIDAGREVVQPWLDLAPPIQMVDAMPYTVMQSIQDDLAPPGRHSYWKSGYLTELTDEAIAAVAGVAASVPSPFSLAELVLWGGAVGRVGADDTAFGQRDGRFLFNAISMWEDPADTDANVAWARGFFDALQPYATDGVYVNFLSEEGDQRVVEAYGAEKYARLARIKAQYDPDNLFRLNQNIAPVLRRVFKSHPEPADSGSCTCGRQDGRSSERRVRGRAILVAAFVVVAVLLGSISAVAAPSGTGSISGHVVDRSGNPLAGICVNVDGGPGLQTDGSGAYTITGLDTGVYKVGFRDCNASPQFVSQWYLGRPDSGAADPLPVTDAVDTSAARRYLGARHVRQRHGHGPARCAVSAASASTRTSRTTASYDWIAGTTTAPDGDLHASASSPRPTSASTSATAASGPFIDQWYDGQSDPNSSTPLVLGAGRQPDGRSTRSSPRRRRSAGRVTDANGNPIAGIYVNVNPTDRRLRRGARPTARVGTRPARCAAGTYRVQFQDSSPNPAWAAQYWNGQPSRNTATVLTLSAADGPVRDGSQRDADAPAPPSRARSPTPTGAPAGERLRQRGRRHAATVPTGSAARRPRATAPTRIGGLPATRGEGLLPGLQRRRAVRRSSGGSNQPDFDSATPLTLHAGRAPVRGRRAARRRGAVITGTVTDSAGHPLAGICAQATTATFVGGMARTRSDGQLLDQPGRGPAATGSSSWTATTRRSSPGEWWDDQPTAATARTVTVGAGQTVDPRRRGAGAGRGRLDLRAGRQRERRRDDDGVRRRVPPEQYALFAPVTPTARYTVAGRSFRAPTRLAFLGCGNGGDPDAGGPRIRSRRVTSYQAVWWNGAPVALTNGQGGPDPIAQGASS